MARRNKFEDFILLFKAVKAAAKGSPQRLETFCSQSEPLRKVINNIEDYLRITDFERRVFHGVWDKPLPHEDTNKAQGKYHIQVPAEFEVAWKEYKDEWEPAIQNAKYGNGMSIDFNELFGDLDIPVSNGGEEDTLPSPDPEFEDDYDPMEHDGGAAYSFLLQLAVHQLDCDPDWDERRSAVAHIGLSAHDYLENTIGIKISEVFDRWREVPIFFIPTQVSNKYGFSEKGSLFSLLDDAIRAYVAGAPAASIAMCRAALEMVLKQHYGLQYQYKSRDGTLRNKGLGELCVLASERYDFVQDGKLKPLVEKANRVMHNYSKTKQISVEDERTIIQFLKTVKFLIQRAP